MLRCEVYRWKRAELAWMLGGLVAAQLQLGLCVDWSWLSVRDPQFVMLQRRLAEREAEAPGRPLVLALGSSRTQMGLRADQLSRTADRSAPLVFNFGLPTSGPMLQRVVLRRLLDQGLRPVLVFVEVMPMSLGRDGGAPLEEHMLDSARLDAAEGVGVLPYYHEPNRLFVRWSVARTLPVYRHQAELRDAFGLDGPLDGPGAELAREVDAYGWRGRDAPTHPEEAAAFVRFALNQYEDALQDLEPAQGPLSALRDLLTLCQKEGIAAALVFPPEASVFRGLYEARHPRIDEEVRRLARAFDVPLYDTRAWIPDDGFWDGHHLAVNGAGQFTERFGREVLGPEMQRLPVRRPFAAAGAR